MRTRFVEKLATMVLLAGASCAFPSSSHDPSCESDETLCPESTRDATSVTCDCDCKLGIDGVDSTSEFSGKVALCLPPELNPMMASDAQRVALTALTPRAFDQRVFNYCGHDVANFLKTLIRSRANVPIAACAIPLSCECTTAGTNRDSTVCHAGCDDVPCEAKNCAGVLRTDTKLSLTACFCSRATACGVSVPAADGPGICRDWLLTSNDLK